MSSETSTSTPASRQDDSALAPWQLFTLAGLLGATVVVFVSRGQTPAGIILLSLTIFTAAVVGVAAWRTLSPFTQSDYRAAPAILGGRTRAALDREKTLMLRAIKELEFDHAMGKVSEADFAEMSTRLRARATRLIAQLDNEGGYAAVINREIAKRIGTDAPARQDARQALAPEQRAARFCASCGNPSDLDARFCKHCGTNLESGR